MSNNLDLTQVAENQASPEAPINDKGGEIDAALTEGTDVSVSAGNASVSAATARRNARLKITGATASGREITLPQIKRQLLIESDSANTQTVTIIRGTTEIEMEPGDGLFVYLDGTTNGLKSFGGGGGGGGGGSTARTLTAFIPGLTVDGARCLRKNVTEAFRMPEDLVGSLFSSGDAATASTTFDIHVNGVSVGAINFASTADTGTATFAADVDTEVGDVVEVFCPATADDTLADIALDILVEML